MYIFNEAKDFLGTAEMESDNSFASIFHLAMQIRTKLGRQGYLLDHYLSIFFDAVYQLQPQDALDDASQAEDPYRKICEAVLDSSKHVKGVPLYDKTLTAIIGKLQIASRNEEYTQLALLYIMMADDFFSDAIKKFARKQEASLSAALDTVRLREVYGQIISITGEPVMETLNLKLKQKFLATPQMMIFAQEFAFDILGWMVLRDIESSRQMFQLILDDMQG